MIKVGVIGYGYWGPNIVRNFNTQENAQVSFICDLDNETAMKARKDNPGIEVVTDPDLLINSDVDIVAIVTPVNTHFGLAIKALKNGKHIFVEKPFTSSVSEAEQLIELAEKKNLKIMVDHTFLFTGAVKKVKELVSENVLGNLFYYDSTRVNLGLFQHDVNVIWDLAPHDLSIMDYVLDEKPVAVAAHGMDHFNRGFEDVAYLTVYFSNNMIAHFNVNWLSPVKIRLTMIGGEKKMLVWDDLQADEKIKIYDKGVTIESTEGIYELLTKYRSGGMWSPRIDNTEALKVEIEYFVDCIVNNKIPFNDGHAGLRVVRLLKASTKSLKNNGVIVSL